MDIKPNCWNEYDELKTVLVCSPSALDVADSQTATDVQWEKPVDQKKAHEHFHNLVHAMESHDIRVIDYSSYLSRQDAQLSQQLINRFFVRDLACVFGNTIIPGEPGTSMRRPEYIQSHFLFLDWFGPDRFKIQANNKGKAIEYGDLMILNKDAIIINTGLRTSYETIQAMKDHIFKAGFSEIGVIDLPRRPDTLHLDMNSNVAARDVFLAKSYMRYLPIQVLTDKHSSYQMMQEFLNRHEYDVEWTNDIKHTVADINFLNLDPETILISTKANKKILKNHPKLKKKKLVEVEVDELEKGGGGIRCMTLPFERRS
ncbi:arginine deiminase [Pontibacillus chungwhensis BH030062]|uniref:Arginine deiminase n=1 Tax=Pontibacillus chungwhensis BH030062 TaxID=1385513 RepID=A0A0A2UTF9_9BACI|nr:arginine deiminase family protein [Pontibacillus chungwhensis]KGP91597.1 arginine deiminase [Pontibacillus chungwhensis BH030062]